MACWPAHHQGCRGWARVAARGHTGAIAARPCCCSFRGAWKWMVAHLAALAACWAGSSSMRHEARSMRHQPPFYSALSLEHGARPRRGSCSWQGEAWPGRPQRGCRRRPPRQRRARRGGRLQQGVQAASRVRAMRCDAMRCSAGAGGVPSGSDGQGVAAGSSMGCRRRRESGRCDSKLPVDLFSLNLS